MTVISDKAEPSGSAPPGYSPQAAELTPDSADSAPGPALSPKLTTTLAYFPSPSGFRTDLRLTLAIAALSYLSLSHALGLPTLSSLPEPWRSLVLVGASVFAAFYATAQLIGRSTPDREKRRATNSVIIGVGWITWSALAYAVVSDRGAHDDTAVAVAAWSVMGAIAVVLGFVGIYLSAAHDEDTVQLVR